MEQGHTRGEISWAISRANTVEQLEIASIMAVVLKVANGMPSTRQDLQKQVLSVDNVNVVFTMLISRAPITVGGGIITVEHLEKAKSSLK